MVALPNKKDECMVKTASDSVSSTIDGLGNSTESYPWHVPERSILQATPALLGCFIKVSYLCHLEPDGICKISLDALHLLGVTIEALAVLQREKLIAWMWNRELQFIQIKAQ